MARRLGRRAQGIGALRAALRIAPSEPALHADLGDALSELGAFGEARRCYMTAWQLNPLLWGGAKTRADELEEEEADARRSGRLAAAVEDARRVLAQAEGYYSAGKA